MMTKEEVVASIKEEFETSNLDMVDVLIGRIADLTVTIFKIKRDMEPHA